MPQFAFLAEAQIPSPVIRLELDHAMLAHDVARYLRSCADRYDAGTQTISSTYFYEIYHADGRQERTTKDLQRISSGTCTTRVSWNSSFASPA